MSHSPKPPKRLAVLTSGGDSAGMNAVVRSVVRMGINRGCECFVVREGWQGLVRGNEDSDVEIKSPVMPLKDLKGKKRDFVATYGEGELLKEGEGEAGFKGRYIIRVGWDDVRGFLGVGGTLIGTARCAEFRDYEGRLKAAHNLIKHGIDALVVCGGDGSLTGADKLRAEWPGMIKELLQQGKITDEQVQQHQHLNIVGLVGSIDNDLAGTDLTIGASTALHRICEAVDSISSTASSHSRAFVIEVMGRHCGWLAVMAANATGADYIFIPEQPPQGDDWATDMCDVLREHRKVGKRKSIIIVAEGATDKNLKPITAEEIKVILSEKLKLDTRVTTLGHTQRGGNPCAYDRVLGVMQGCEAVETLLSSGPDTPSKIIGLAENQITRINMMEAIKQTQAVAENIAKKDFKTAMSLRDPEFEECLKAFVTTSRLDGSSQLPESKRLRIGIMHVGAPAGGMNAATRTAVRYCLARGHTPLGIYNSFNGLLSDNVSELSWLRVDQWTTRGGSELGTNRTLPDVDLEGIAGKLKEHKVDALMLIGGFEAFTSLLIMQKGREQYSKLKIPMVHLPATISNNVPVTEWSLGSDTSVNVLVEACDMIKQSATASRSRVFVVETQGGECGYISVAGALAVGALAVYAPETGMSLDMLKNDIDFLKQRYQSDVQGKSEGRLIIRSEKASSCYTTDVVTNILRDEGKQVFDARSVQLGHTLQGGTPSPRDRTRGVRLAIKCINFLETKTLNEYLFEDSKKIELPQDDNIAVICVSGARLSFVSLQDMVKNADMKKRRGKNPWWLNLKSVVELMAGKQDLSEEPSNGVAVSRINAPERAT